MFTRREKFIGKKKGEPNKEIFFEDIVWADRVTLHYIKVEYLLIVIQY